MSYPCRICIAGPARRAQTLTRNMRPVWARRHVPRRPPVLYLIVSARRDIVNTNTARMHSRSSPRRSDARHRPVPVRHRTCAGARGTGPRRGHQAGAGREPGGAPTVNTLGLRRQRSASRVRSRRRNRSSASTVRTARFRRRRLLAPLRRRPSSPRARAGVGGAADVQRKRYRKQGR